MFHIPASYRGNELHATLTSDAPRGVGVELRCYQTSTPMPPKPAPANFGYTILAGCARQTPWLARMHDPGR